MKKTYIAPEMSTIELIHPNLLISASVEGTGLTSGGSASGISADSPNFEWDDEDY